MLRRTMLIAMSALALACWGGAPVCAQQTEPRIAFVVGNASYGPGVLPNALNDAGLVAEALRSIGFEIVEGADLGQADLLRSFRDFLASVEASGPDTLAVVYFSGHALSFEGDNFLLGVDARLERDTDIPIEAVRLPDLLRPLAASPARAKVVMIDAARPLPFRPRGRGLARGLEAIEAPPGMLVAFSSAPGTVAPGRPGDYGAYAVAIAEMLRAPGIDLDTAFTHIRSRTHLSTQGQQTPWHVSALTEPIELVPPEAATAVVPPPPRLRAPRPMIEIGPDEAYALAIEMDTLEGYVAFVEVYPRHPYAPRIWAMIRARREALAWMRALHINTPQAYWTYLRRYPNGMYAFDAERRLRRLSAPFAPPPGFAMLEFDDVPMALVGEPREYVDVYRVGPPPPRVLMPPPPAFFVRLPPPRHVRPRGLPALSAPIPVVPRLAPAPRRVPPAAGRAPAVGLPPAAVRTPAAPPPATAARPPAAAPGAVAPPPPTAVRRPPGAVPSVPPPASPTTRTPGVTPRAVTPAPGTAPPPVGRRAPAAGPAATPPADKVAPTPGAPKAVTPKPSVVPPPGASRPAGAGSPSATAPTPPAAARPPAPPPAVRSAPPPKPTPPPTAGAQSPPPPRAAKPATQAKPPACPAGKRLVNGVCQ
jgi:hypothetical protein